MRPQVLIEPLHSEESKDGSWNQERIRTLVSRQREFFRTGKTRERSFRLEQLRKLEETIRTREAEICDALKADLGKAPAESFMAELSLVYEEIYFISKRLKEWMRPQPLGTPFLYAPAKSYVYSEPLGLVLIIGPWNYPFQLMIAPLVGAIAAGNCAVLKPSEFAPRTSAIVAKLIEACFEPAFVAAVEGGAETSQSLLAEKFDHIFFTGGAPVARTIMSAAAEHLTPVTLELGGKSPGIVDSEVNIAVAARRLTWGKFFNAGQTCIAPDYLLVHKTVKDDLIKHIAKTIEEFFGKDPSTSPDYGRIINKRHFDRLAGLLNEGKVVVGGVVDRETLYIAPTVVTNVRVDGELMAEEIFGPLLPVLEYEDLSQAIAFVGSRPKPLALYFFSRDRRRQERVLSELAFGGGCINDTLLHMTSPHLPFGGVGESGMGAYHGKASFDLFSHRKAVTRKPFWMDLTLRYPPYKKRIRWLRRFMR